MLKVAKLHHANQGQKKRSSISFLQSYVDGESCICSAWFKSIYRHPNSPSLHLTSQADSYSQLNIPYISNYDPWNPLLVHSILLFIYIHSLSELWTVPPTLASIPPHARQPPVERIQMDRWCLLDEQNQLYFTISVERLWRILYTLFRFLQHTTNRSWRLLAQKLW